MNPYFLQILLWTGYGALHTILATTIVKLFFAKNTGSLFRYYRLFYNLLAIVLLLGLWRYQQTMPAEPLWHNVPIIKWLGYVLILTSVLLLGLALKGYNLGEFVGIKSSWTNEADTSNSLKTSGLLSYVRHPLYTATIMLVVGLFLADSLLRTLIMAICVMAYIRIRIYFEEQKLIQTFGEGYTKYRKNVPMLFPKI